MSKPYAGGCACGAIRYEARSEPIVQNHCQCRDCQKRSGTGHGSYLTFPQRDDVTVTGEAKTWRIAGDSGKLEDGSRVRAVLVEPHVGKGDEPTLSELRDALAGAALNHRHQMAR